MNTLFERIFAALQKDLPDVSPDREELTHVLRVCEDLAASRQLERDEEFRRQWHDSYRRPGAYEQGQL